MEKLIYNLRYMKTSEAILLAGIAGYVGLMIYLMGPNTHKENFWSFILPGKVRYTQDGRLSSQIKRKTIDGKVEEMEVLMDPARFLTWQKGGLNLNGISIGSDSQYYKKRNFDLSWSESGDFYLGINDERKIIKGQMTEDSVQWDGLQGTDEARKEKIHGHKVNNTKEGIEITDY